MPVSVKKTWWWRMLCSNAGGHYRTSVHFDEAETVTREAIAMQRKMRGEDSAKEATSLCSLSDTLRHQADIRGDRANQLAEAESAARAGLAIRRIAWVTTVTIPPGHSTA